MKNLSNYTGRLMAIFILIVSIAMGILQWYGQTNCSDGFMIFLLVAYLIISALFWYSDKIDMWKGI